MIKEFAKNHEEAILNLIRDLCRIPAPSHDEGRRAEYCKAYFESFGAEGVYIDEVKNVIFPLNCEGSDEITVIAALSEIVCELYKIQVPKKENTITTYNVGTIEGGTSVNTIAQKATMLCEYRSNDRECLETMKKEFERIFAEANTDETKITVNLIGNRPCKGEVDTVAETRHRFRSC